jgi:hypothetical protein
MGLAELPRITVPELFVRAHGRRVVSLVAEMLADELDVGDATGADAPPGTGGSR